MLVLSREGQLHTGLVWEAQAAGQGMNYSPVLDSCRITARVRCPVWAPQHKKDIGKLEQVWWRTIKMTRGLKCMRRA